MGKQKELLAILINALGTYVICLHSMLVDAAVLSEKKLEVGKWPLLLLLSHCYHVCYFEADGTEPQLVICQPRDYRDYLFWLACRLKHEQSASCLLISWHILLYCIIQPWNIHWDCIKINHNSPYSLITVQLCFAVAPVSQKAYYVFLSD